MMQQYEITANLARQIQEEGKKWRSRYLEAEQNVKKYERKFKKLNKPEQQPMEEVIDTQEDEGNEDHLFFDI